MTHRHIMAGAILCALAAAVLQGCSDDFDKQTVPDFETMIREGKYLRARNADISLASDNSGNTAWFPIGTPYRLLVYAKPDPGTYGAEEAQEPATHARFNRVTQEAEANGFRYIDIEGNADILFGFTPLEGETGGVDERVSLDFYGFTYGEKAENVEDYIEIDGLEGETRPEDGTLATLKRTERVTDGKLADLRHGILLNRSVSTVNGKAAFSQQSAVPFSHSFSRLEFQYVQQPDDDGVTPRYKDLYIDDVKVTGTYNEGSVYLQTGKVELPEKDSYGNANLVSRPLEMTTRASVPVNQTDLGNMLIFPSDGNSLTSGGDGYVVGLDITLKSPEEKVINNFLARSGSAEKAEQKEDGYWYGVIRRPSVMNSETNETLYFSSNTRYVLVISLQENTVRIITVIPQVEDWIHGEGTDERPWQTQYLGQPQMFDNIIWSDRNLGADHYNPSADFEGTVGYFYQAGRNIPYFPFNTTLYANEARDKGLPESERKKDVPTPWDKRTHTLAGETSYQKTVYRLYPMVDPEILKMYRQKSSSSESNAGVGSRGCDIWSLNPSNVNVQLKIPESVDNAGYYDFMNATYTEGNDMNWSGGTQNQPVSGSWQIPTSNDYMSIFPTTPQAGNITFGKCASNEFPMNWEGGRSMDAKCKTLRVTVPYYKVDMAEPTGRSDKYMEAWHTLLDNGDAGTTHEEFYNPAGAPGNENNVKCESDGDPEDGYASVYVISRDNDNVEGVENKRGLPANLSGLEKFTIKEWGTIYGIKRVYTNQAYRMRWRVLVDENPHGDNPGLYVEICRYRCNKTDRIDETNYLTQYDWDHPAARIYFPICGLGDWSGAYINFGTECMYATSDPIVHGNTGAVQIKITGDDYFNEYMAVVKVRMKTEKPSDVQYGMNRNFGMQIRPIGTMKH